jgi:hypothetical protein
VVIISPLGLEFCPRQGYCSGDKAATQKIARTALYLSHLLSRDFYADFLSTTVIDLSLTSSFSE